MAPDYKLIYKICITYSLYCKHYEYCNDIMFEVMNNTKSISCIRIFIHRWVNIYSFLCLGDFYVLMEPFKENKSYTASHHSPLLLLMKDLVLTGFRLKLCTIDRLNNLILKPNFPQNILYKFSKDAPQFHNICCDFCLQLRMSSWLPLKTTDTEYSAQYIQKKGIPLMEKVSTLRPFSVCKVISQQCYVLIYRKLSYALLRIWCLG
jgi:hypothetical protein